MRMSPVLTHYSFDADDWDEIQAFDCGDRDYEREVAEWLKSPADPPPPDSCALLDIAKDPPARIWLYRLEGDEDESTEDSLVGFGALDKSRWRWTTKKSPYIPISMILWFSVQKPYRRQPPGDEDGFYSSLIMDHLISEAFKEQHERPVLGLCVRPTNTRAIALYRRKHFTVDLDPYTDKRTGVQYARMARILDPVRLGEMVAGLS